MIDEEIRLTEPFLPPLSELMPMLEQIWESKWLTNGGPLHASLEEAIADYLNVKYVSLVTNGTLGLIISLKALGVSGEVITTPYTFVATTHSLLWNNLTPVFVDVDPDTLNISAAAIENAITPNTKAIVPVHCYGNPCEMDAIETVAKKHDLAIIYDAAHAFGVQMKSGNILDYGKASVLSFHATKSFNTFEGGAIVTHTQEDKQLIDDARNFGFSDEVTVNSTGINAKLNEFSCAIGLLQLKHYDRVVMERSAVDRMYRERIAVSGIRCFQYGESIKSPNYSYFPIFVGDDYPLSRDELYEKYRKAGIWVRRYFYPLVSDFPMYRKVPSATKTSLPNAAATASQVLCLPIYPGLTEPQVNKIVKVLSN